MSRPLVDRRKNPSDNKLIAPDSIPRVILLVEDNRDIRDMIATALQGQGYRLVLATTPEEGVALLRESKYDLVVAHYNLPGKTAPVMLQEAAAAGLLKATPTLVVTAHPDPQGIERESIVRKPLDLDKFLLQVQRIFASGSVTAPKKDRRTSAAAVVELALYVNKVWITSTRARENLERILDGYVRTQVRLKIYDVADDPLAGEADQVVFTPTLVKRSPPPRAWVVGDLSDDNIVKSLLDMSGIQRRA
jgi:CheY-like chemotaxis protein